MRQERIKGSICPFHVFLDIHDDILQNGRGLYILALNRLDLARFSTSSLFNPYILNTAKQKCILIK